MSVLSDAWVINGEGKLDPPAVQRNFERLSSVVEVVTVTGAVLPRGYDGQVIDYLADATTGVLWRFKYRAASASAFKWEFCGGSPLMVSPAPGGGADTISSTVYVALPTATSLVAPIAGDYVVGFSCGRVDSAGPTGVGQTLVSPSVGAAAVDADMAGWRSDNFAPGGRVKRFNGLAAAAVVALHAKAANGNGRVFERDLWIRPFRAS